MSRREAAASGRGLELKPRHDQFTIESDEDDDDAPEKVFFPSPPIFRHVRDTHNPPTFAHVLVNRLLLRWFPRIVLFFLVAAIIITLLPGGWRVFLCACDLIPAPQRYDDDHLTLIGHRGSEFPYPENTIQALEDAIKYTSFVEIDVALTSDENIILMHDNTYNHTTNGTGVTCMRDLEYVQSLEVSMPERDPRGHIAQAKYCTQPRGSGTVPCVYRVPLLSDVFDALPTNTSFIININDCYAPGVESSTPICSNCTLLRDRIQELMTKHFINPNRVVFASAQEPSLAIFRNSLSPNSSYGFSAGVHQFAHYKVSTFLNAIDHYDAVNIDLKLAVIRPDLVHAVRTSRTPDGSRFRHVYSWTVRHDFEYRLARCSGSSRILVAEPSRIVKRFVWRDLGPFLSAFGGE